MNTRTRQSARPRTPPFEATGIDVHARSVPEEWRVQRDHQRVAQRGLPAPTYNLGRNRNPSYFVTAQHN